MVRSYYSNPEDHPLSAGCEYFFNIFADTLHICRVPHQKFEAAPNRGTGRSFTMGTVASHGN
jgi:hypothetical protein